jgi:NCS1 family nucleobase:cation symporter-1
VMPSPIGATVPTFFIAFVLYLGWAMVTKRVITQNPVSTHLSCEM